MKHLLTLSLMLLIASCASAPPLEHGPAMWQYDDDKFVSFKKQVVMSWEYDDPTIGCFEVDREMKPLSDADKVKIPKLVKDENKKELIKVVKAYQGDFDGEVISYPAKDEREFRDLEKEPPKFEHIYFYRLYALEKCDPEIATPIRSDPAELSVIILHPIE